MKGGFHILRHWPGGGGGGSGNDDLRWHGGEGGFTNKWRHFWSPYLFSNLRFLPQNNYSKMAKIYLFIFGPSLKKFDDKGQKSRKIGWRNMWKPPYNAAKNYRVCYCKMYINNVQIKNVEFSVLKINLELRFSCSVPYVNYSQMRKKYYIYCIF